MDKIVHQHDTQKAKDMTLVSVDDSVCAQALCFSPIWDDMAQEDAEKLSVRAPSRQSSPLHTLKWLASVLSQSPTLSALTDELDLEEWGFVVSRDSTHSYKIDIENDVVVLPSLMKKTHSRHNLLLNTIRALRDMWYEDNHFDLYETLQLEEWLKWERLRAADIETFTVMVAWELRIAGERDLWRALMGSDIGDMAMVFQAIDEQQGDITSYDVPLLHSFRQWFMAEDRINDTDSATLAIIDHTVLNQMLQEPFGEERLCGDDIEMRITLPNEKPYLENMEHLLNDPEFCAIPNDINQTHFFHIMNDLETVNMSGVRFRDKDLAKKIFPDRSKCS